MHRKKYRLSQYIITEYEGNVFTWETHIALGSQLLGNCFIIGDILVIGPRQHEDAGFLILEFYEQLRKLKVWNKTRYYCSNLSLWDVESGQNLSRNINQGLGIATNEQAPGSFHLGKYKIVVEQNGNISWHTWEGLNKIISGKCLIESCILFIGNREFELCESQKKREWIKTLKDFPKWDRTVAWGHLNSLQDCHHENNKRGPIRIFNNAEAEIKNKYPVSSLAMNFQNKNNGLLSDLDFIWRRLVGWGGWQDYVSPLIIKTLARLCSLLLFIFKQAFKCFSKTMRRR